jgi:murein endopeptidase
MSTTIFDKPVNALTISAGEPFRGRLINGVKFPSQLHGYKLLDENRSFTTPEVVGALLKASKAFKAGYPDSCDIVLGDFSCRGGGRLKGHRSHQNGRDVDIGLFAKDNAPLECLVPMNSNRLDVAKTWYMIRSLLSTHCVELIFLDRRIQARLYRHALNEGANPDDLSKIFANAGGRGKPDCLIQHEPGHISHMHVRFFAPWSTLAGTLKEIDPWRQMAIETAQWFHPQPQVNPSARGIQTELNQMAHYNGVMPGAD